MTSPNFAMWPSSIFSANIHFLWITELVLEERQFQKIHRILPTSMEVSTATISACRAKSLIVRQLLIHCTCVISSSLNDELVAVEDSIDVGNVLYHHIWERVNFKTKYVQLGRFVYFQYLVWASILLLEALMKYMTSKGNISNYIIQ